MPFIPQLTAKPWKSHGKFLVDGNLDNGDADYQGKYSFSTCYNSERALTVQGASANEPRLVCSI